MPTPSVRHILFATDFSACSQAAGEVAAELAGLYRAQLHALHVADGSPAGDYLLPLREATARLGRDLDKRPILIVDQGSPAEAIVRYARRKNIDLVVMGTRGRSGLPYLVHGSVAATVMRTAPCAVLTVKEHASPPAAPPPLVCYICGGREAGPICPTCSARVTGEIRARWQDQLSHR